MSVLINRWLASSWNRRASSHLTRNGLKSCINVAEAKCRWQLRPEVLTVVRSLTRRPFYSAFARGITLTLFDSHVKLYILITAFVHLHISINLAHYFCSYMRWGAICRLALLFHPKRPHPLPRNILIWATNFHSYNFN